MYWFDWNTSDGWWRPVDSIVPEWTYMDRSGNIKTGNDCWQDHRKYTHVINPETSGVLVKYE